MKFNTERDAWNHYVSLYQFHWEDAPTVDMFRDWVDDQGITWLDEDMAEFLRRWNNDQ